MGRKTFAINEPCILPFARLGALAKALLTIPNSNAALEKTFSMVKKIFTEQRSQLGNSTLSALLKCKLNEDTICTEFAPCGCERTLRLARVACTSYNDLCTSSAQERVCILFRAFCCTAVSISCLYFVYLYISVFFIYVICTFQAVFTFIFINLSQNCV